MAENPYICKFDSANTVLSGSTYIYSISFVKPSIMTYPVFNHICHLAFALMLGLSAEAMGQTVTSVTNNHAAAEGITHISSKILRGDANNDGHINISDVTVIIVKILGQDPQNFYFSGADTDDNGLINITDVCNIINIILYGAPDTDDPRLPTDDPEGGNPGDGI